MATLEEIQTVIKKLKTGKSPDSSGISAEHFRYTPERGYTVLSDYSE
jgi:hypothetical protein